MADITAQLNQLRSLKQQQEATIRAHEDAKQQIRQVLNDQTLDGGYKRRQYDQRMQAQRNDTTSRLKDLLQQAQDLVGRTLDAIAQAKCQYDAAELQRAWELSAKPLMDRSDPRYLALAMSSVAALPGVTGAAVRQNLGAYLIGRMSGSSAGYVQKLTRDTLDTLDQLEMQSAARDPQDQVMRTQEQQLKAASDNFQASHNIALGAIASDTPVYGVPGFDQGSYVSIRDLPGMPNTQIQRGPSASTQALADQLMGGSGQ